MSVCRPKLSYRIRNWLGKIIGYDNVYTWFNTKQYWYWLVGKLGLCEHCAHFRRLEFNTTWESSRTAYHWNGKGLDPNRDVRLCKDCAEEHHRYWSDMWSNVPGHGSW